MKIVTKYDTKSTKVLEVVLEAAHLFVGGLEVEEGGPVTVVGPIISHISLSLQIMQVATQKTPRKRRRAKQQRHKFSGKKFLKF